ncbi:het-domain-containing protein [Fusarium napiforme]|uniref:Het-domain-containing protein n=1 Tax=Fusarium napiforme TaxID=42672 RepID=A0A8H5MM74_9HYPO|nr:het-domain-containing protein [Fusarium napiforme]
MFFSNERENEIPWVSDLGVPWQDNLDTLAESAALNCPLCTIIQHAVKNWSDRLQAGRNSSDSYQGLDADYMTTFLNKRLYLTRRFGGGSGLVVFISRSDSAALLLGSVAFTVDEASPLARELQLRPFWEDSGSSGALRVVSSWLKNCQDNHEKCYYDQTALPSRVLAVGSIGGSSIKLIEPDAGTVGKYASLSHCWGSVPMLTTTHASLHARMSGISVTDLPKTFRDAVLLSRYLGIPYLWIDSLCIIQGDKQDWARESSRMMDVYSNAYVVIAANRASDSSEGCFHIRPSRVSANLRFPDVGLVHAQLGANSDELLYANDEFFDEPLTKRAWALQERFLAARTIHYNTGQMYFECRYGIVGEDGSKTDMPHCDLSPVMNHTCSASEALQIWWTILWNYSNRNLTNPTDKFPALSGIASLLGGLLKDEYVAGLWSSTMVQGLAWRGFWRPKPQPVSEYIGPTWSWASLQGIAALNEEPEWRSIAVVEDWQVELTNPDNHYGQVKSASVRVRGPITKLTQSTISDDPDEDERLKRAEIRLWPRVYTKYSGQGVGMFLHLDNRELNASDQLQDMDIKVLLLGTYGGKLPVSRCEAKGEEAESKKNKGNTQFKVGDGFGLVLTSTNVNGDICMKRVGWTILACNEVEKLRGTSKDWDTVTII